MITKMMCPHCGTEMNFHAEKLTYSEPILNPALGGHVEEVFTCPRCGITESRVEA
jgi:predicted RNA-binding Zn-ribbon protein involved in translation (DUF1610 family)